LQSSRTTRKQVEKQKATKAEQMQGIERKTEKKKVEAKKQRQRSKKGREANKEA
jgi:hypothetical protein